MKMDIDLIDPTGQKITTVQVEIPIMIYPSQTVSSQNWYILHIGDNKIRINKDGSIKLENEKTI